MMGIQIEFNPDLALRNISHFKEGKRKKEECVPEDLKADETYDFLKSGQRNYWFEGELPLLETSGDQSAGDARLSRPLASILIVEVTHFTENDKVFTKGKYLVKEVFDKDEPKINFESYRRV